MIEIAGGIVLGFLGLGVLGMLLSLDWSTRPAQAPDPAQTKADNLVAAVFGIPLALFLAFCFLRGMAGLAVSEGVTLVIWTVLCGIALFGLGDRRPKPPKEGK